MVNNNTQNVRFNNHDAYSKVKEEQQRISVIIE
jgi:hypothetical protein